MSIFEILPYQLSINELIPLYEIDEFRLTLDDHDFLTHLRRKHKLPEKLNNTNNISINGAFERVVDLFDKYYSTKRYRDSINPPDKYELAIDNQNLDQLKTYLEEFRQDHSEVEVLKRKKNLLFRAGEIGFGAGIDYLLIDNISYEAIGYSDKLVDGLTRGGHINLLKKYFNDTMIWLSGLFFALAHDLEVGKVGNFNTVRQILIHNRRFIQEQKFCPSDIYNFGCIQNIPSLIHLITEIHNGPISYNVKYMIRIFFAKYGNNDIDHEIKKYILHTNSNISKMMDKSISDFPIYYEDTICLNELLGLNMPPIDKCDSVNNDYIDDDTSHCYFNELD